MSATTDGHWVLIERENNPDALVGPYPDEAAAVLAMEEALLIDGLCEEDSLDCNTVTISGFDPAWDVHIIDPDDPDHTGA